VTDRTHPRGLGRIQAPDDEHIRKYALRPETMPTNPESLVVGIAWSETFDNPVEKKAADGTVEYWAGLDPNNLGAVRGGHCVCLPYDHTLDSDDNWAFYDQGATGCCVGFGWARRQALANNCRYDGFSLYDWAVQHDDLPDTNDRQSGTTVRAGGECLRVVGAWREDAGGAITGPFVEDGIQEYVWATKPEEMLAVLKNPLYTQRGAVPLVNNWGKYYPHVVWVPMETWSVVLFPADRNNQGDCALVTDRPGGGVPTPPPQPPPPPPPPTPKPKPKPKPKPHRPHHRKADGGE
jgi:hypothetical protein